MVDCYSNFNMVRKRKITIKSNNVHSFRKKEHYRKRHRRRWKTAVENITLMEAWCNRVGIDLKITDEGKNWKFSYDGKVAEWNPSSANLMFDRDNQTSLHVYDHLMVAKILTGRFDVNPLQI